MNWKHFWDEKAQSDQPGKQVGRIVGGSLMQEELLQKIADKIARQLQLKTSDFLLDVCCGNGELSKLLLGYCQEIHGVDFSEKLIVQARKHENKQLSFHCASASDFELKQTFDKVLLYFSFQYFESYAEGKKVIANLLKHCRPGATILIGDITDRRKFFTYYHTPRKWMEYLKQSLSGTNNMGKFWHPDELHQICNQLGVQGKCIQQENWQPYAAYRFDFLITKPV